MTIQEIKNEIRKILRSSVGEGEADAMSKIILEEVKGYTPVELLINANRDLLPDTITRIRKIVDCVINGQPLQYILGATWWRGRRFVVNPSVLIPRPETSELVDIIVDENKDRGDLSVLDIGTGSGCIAVSLALDLPFSNVTAIDISEKALETAAVNARNLRAKVDFYKVDIYSVESSPIAEQKFDIIVSNPPYILESERSEIEPRVKDYEPKIALFVDDEKKIDIYQSIIDYTSDNLKKGGKLYLEINPLCANEIKHVLVEEADYENIEVLRDYKGNVRFVTAIHK